MCLLICIRRYDGSLVVAANRDERRDRPADGPLVWTRRPGVLAGVDRRGGGTWLAVNPYGVVAAVTNRPTDDGEDPARPSRGELPLIAAGQTSAVRGEHAVMARLGQTRYNGFNLLIADRESAWVFQGPTAQVSLDPIWTGIHIVANGAFNDDADPRVARARTLLDRAPAEVDALIERLAQVCADTAPCGDRPALCVAGGEAGTVSSSILHIDADRRLGRYLHAPGPPSECDYRAIDVDFARPE